MKVEVGNKVIIKCNGDIVSFGQCYDGMTGVISGIVCGRWSIKLDKKSSQKIDKINHITNRRWTVCPTIPFQYVYPQSNKELELELE